MITAPRTVLVVASNASLRREVHEGLPDWLPNFGVVTAATTTDAASSLRVRSVDVLVTEIDGATHSDLLHYVRVHHPNLAVVVVSDAPADVVRATTEEVGLVRILRPPVTVESLATAVTAAHGDVVRGRLGRVGLSSVIELMQLERSTCSLLVRNEGRKGRLHFRDGELVDAYAFELDVDGETAARHVLTWDAVSIDFERSLHNVERKIHTPVRELQLQVATDADAGTDRTHATSDAASGSHGVPTAPPAGARPRASRGSASRGSAARGNAVGADDHGLDAGLDGLVAALGALRASRARVAERLADAEPFVRGPGAAWTVVPRVTPDDEAAWRTLAERAARLADAAARFAAGAGRTDD